MTAILSFLLTMLAIPLTHAESKAPAEKRNPYYLSARVGAADVVGSNYDYDLELYLGFSFGVVLDSHWMIGGDLSSWASEEASFEVSTTPLMASLIYHFRDPQFNNSFYIGPLIGFSRTTLSRPGREPEAEIDLAFGGKFGHNWILTPTTIFGAETSYIHVDDAGGAVWGVQAIVTLWL